MPAKAYQRHAVALRDNMSPALKLGLTISAATLVFSYWIYAPQSIGRSYVPSLSAGAANNRMDAEIQLAASTSLGEREGTIIVIDPQTGRVRAVVNLQTAFQEAYPPGSTIKPFTALAALRAGLVDRNSRTLCREKYNRNDSAVVCSHPRNLAPFNPTEAIAYSCNYYFAKLGERLSETDFDKTLIDFGFGQRTGINADRESPGKLLRGEWQSQNAIGEGPYLQVSPIQLLTAYSALLNGGRLLTPTAASSEDFTPRVRATIRITDEERSVILEGMHGAVKYGTAERAGLTSLPLYIVGKTGTSTPVRGFRTQGWFVGFAVAPGEQPAAPNISLGVLVYLRKAHGAEAAEYSKPVFAAYAHELERMTPAGRREDAETGRQGDRGTGGKGDMGVCDFDPLVCSGSASPRLPLSLSPHLPVSVSPRLPLSASPHLPFPPSPFPSVSVHLVRENITRALSLEEYVLGVVSSEGSIEDEPEALRALAVVARTYALKNLRRHQNQGYDFCSTTHCQRFVSPDSVNQAKSQTILAAAVRDTAGQVLVDHHGRVADSYFGASCGGFTANLHTLWGSPAPGYLHGVRDEYCTSGPHHEWTDVISSARLAEAMRSDPRTDVGESIHRLFVTRRDQTGRAELITIQGDKLRTISGWEFKLIVGRVLGWNVLKSSRFSVAQFGSSFVFHGAGFGHGLGLCQEGSHVMAQQGFAYRQILAKYFPGTLVQNCGLRTADCGFGRVLGKPETRKTAGASQSWSGGKSHADLLWETSRRRVSFSNPQSPVRNSRFSSVSSEHFRLVYPEATRKNEIGELLRLLESNRTSLLRSVTAAGILVRLPRLEIYLNETTGDFVGRTGQPWWAAAATKGRDIELQPLGILRKRGILETTLHHELVHIVVDELGAGRTPRWLAEGLALNLAGEGPMIRRYQPKLKFPLSTLEQKLTSATTAGEMRTAYAGAYDEVRRLIRSEGESRVWQRVARREE